MLWGLRGRLISDTDLLVYNLVFKPELSILEILVRGQQHPNPWTVVGEIFSFPLYVDGPVSNVNRVLKCMKNRVTAILANGLVMSSTVD